jgi:hypothetical protein
MRTFSEDAELPQKLLQGDAQLVDEIGLPAMIAVHHAGFDVACQKFDAHLVQRAPNGGDLIEQVDAIAIFIDHLAYSGNLARYEAQASGRPLFYFWQQCIILLGV